jgi:hypothetical protein
MTIVEGRGELFLSVERWAMIEGSDGVMLRAEMGFFIISGRGVSYSIVEG